MKRYARISFWLGSVHSMMSISSPLILSQSPMALSLEEVDVLRVTVREGKNNKGRELPRECPAITSAPTGANHLIFT